MNRLAREHAHLIAAVALGVALGVPPAPPLLGFALAAALGAALYKMGVFSEEGRARALEYVGALALAWVLTASLLHY
ncbi:MAG: hypothetical protein DRJ67_09040 [Thermoprotei archaeon]|nr:MAG: hypothetical protein DRJ67_09040 [Thermoprotei archaeon]